MKRISITSLVLFVGLSLVLIIQYKINHYTAVRIAQEQEILQSLKSQQAELQSIRDSHKQEISEALKNQQLEFQSSLNEVNKKIDTTNYRSSFPHKQLLDLSIDLSSNLERYAIRRGTKEDAKDTPWLPVSMTQISASQFVVANYRNLYLINEKTKTITNFPRPDVPVWHPTGVEYSPYYNALFVANYTGGDILVFRIVAGKLQLIERITDSIAIKNPEGIAVSPGGRYMAITDNEGGTVSVFERSLPKKSWTLRWTKPLIAAHGVSIYENEVYVSGIELARFDLATGNELQKVNKLGDLPILFATCVTPGPDHRFIISDAIRGTINITDHEFNLLEKIGSNGPSYKQFNMPYCAYDFSGRIFILSTYQDRIISLRGKKVTSWGDLRGWAKERFFPGEPSHQWDNYVKNDSPQFKLYDRYFLPGYGSIESNDLTLTMPSRKGALSAGWLYYITTVSVNKNYTAIVSNSSPSAIIMNNSTGAIGSVGLKEWDCWARETSIECPLRSYTLNDLVKSATMVTAASSLKEISATLKIPEQEISNEFSTDAGKKFINQYHLACNQDDVNNAKTSYVNDTNTKSRSLVEFAFVHLLTKGWKTTSADKHHCGTSYRE